MIRRVLLRLNKTNVSPLICYKSSTNLDLLESFEELHRSGNLLSSWMELFLLGQNHVLRDLENVFNSIDETRDDNMIWTQGLSLLHLVIFSKNSTVAPHEIISILLESYCCRDDKHWVCSFDSMIVLRSLLIAYSIQSAESRTRHSLQHSEVIRWRRLKSMLTDSITLFHRMLCEDVEVANGICEDSGEPQTGRNGIEKKGYFIKVATWLYTRQILPICASLMSLLLEQNQGDGIADLNDGVAAKFLGMLTTLLALGGRDAVLTAINDYDEFFRYVRSIGHLESKLDGSGVTLLEDLLLYRRPYFCNIGQANLALLVLQNQLHPNNGAATLCPAPLSGEYRWSLSFPHTITFLANDNLSHANLGFDLLSMLINETHFIRPARRRNHTSVALQRAQSSELLTNSIHTLLTLVLRISALEASLPNASTFLEYSSLDVMNLAKQLLSVYTAKVQVHVIAKLAQNMRDPNQTIIALLPKVLDWLRPLILDVCSEHLDLILLCEIIAVLDPMLGDLEEVFDELKPLPKDIPKFFSMIEAYTSLFSSLRAIKTSAFNETVKSTLPDYVQHSSISKWLQQSLKILLKFKERLENLIHLWTASEATSPPPDHHRCLLLHYHLEVAVIELSEKTKS